MCCIRLNNTISNNRGTFAIKISRDISKSTLEITQQSMYNYIHTTGLQFPLLLAELPLWHRL